MADEDTRPATLFGEAAAAGGVQDVTVGWASSLGRQNQDPVLASRGGDLVVYEELLRDSAVSIAFSQRQLALIGKDLIVEPGAEDALSKAAADDLRAQLEAIPFDRITAAMLTGRILGYAVGECMWELAPDKRRVILSTIRVRKARRFRFAADGSLLLRTRARVEGEPTPERKFWRYTSDGDVTDDPYGFGLGQILYWLVWFKRQGVQLWLRSLDRNASPPLKGEFPPGAPVEEQQKLLQALQAMRSASALVAPVGSVVSYLEGAKVGTADHSALYTMLDEAITMVIAGQTMTSRQGSSEAQARVHLEVLGSIVEADDDLLNGSFNAGPAQWLTDWNFPGAAYPRVRRQTEPPADLKAQSEIDRALIDMGYEPSLQYIQETYGHHWTKAVRLPPAFEPPGGDDGLTASAEITGG